MPGNILTEEIAERSQAGPDYPRQLNQVIKQRTPKWQKLIIIRGTIIQISDKPTHCERYTNPEPVQKWWNTTIAEALEKWVCSI